MQAEKITAQCVAERVGGKVIGDGNIELSSIKPLETAGPKDLSFFAPTSKRNVAELMGRALSCKASAIILPEEHPEIKAVQIVVEHPLVAVVELSPVFYQPPRPSVGVDVSARVAQTAEVASGVSIGAFCSIGDGAVIGEGCVLHPHVVIYPGAVLEAGCEVHSGAVIREYVRVGKGSLIGNGAVVGGDGFGFIPDPKVGHRRIPHTGVTVLEEGVDIGANATIDRATYGETRIGANTKIDNLVMVGHNVKIGSNTLLCSQVGVSGSTTIGNSVLLAGQVGVADHVEIGDKVRAAAKCGVTRSIESNRDVAGFPAMNVMDWRRREAMLRRLPEKKKNKKGTQVN